MNAIARNVLLVAAFALGATACGVGSATHLVTDDVVMATERASSTDTGAAATTQRVDVAGARHDATLLACQPAGGVSGPGDPLDDGVGEPSPLPVRGPGG